MAWIQAAPWLITLIVLVLAAGSITPAWSLTRRFHRYFVAPLYPDGPTEDPTSFLRADALLSVLAFAGAVFVFAGVAPLGWALVGLATLNLLTLFMTDPESRHFLFIGAYRDNEVDEGHPFIRSMAEVRRERRGITELTLAPLAPEDLLRLLPIGEQKQHKKTR